jgi:hypothetical protein
VEGFRFTAGYPLFADRRAPSYGARRAPLYDAGTDVVGTTCTDAGSPGITTPNVLSPTSRDSIIAILAAKLQQWSHQVMPIWASDRRGRQRKDSSRLHGSFRLQAQLLRSFAQRGLAGRSSIMWPANSRKTGAGFPKCSTRWTYCLRLPSPRPCRSCKIKRLNSENWSFPCSER